MKSLILCSVGLLAVQLCATPSIPESSVSIDQDPVTRVACLRYTLTDGPAVVTADVFTNGVNVGAGLLENAVDAGYGISPNGERINCVIRQDGQHELYFRPMVEGGAVLNAGEVSVRVRCWAMDAPPDWMSVDLLTPSNIAYYAEEASIPGGMTNRLYKTTKLLMRKIPAKNCTWRMGSPSDEPEHAADEECRYVTLSQDYYLGVYELTQAQHSNAFVNAGMSYYSGSKPSVSSYAGEDAAVHPLENLAPYYFRWVAKTGDTEPGMTHGAVGSRSFCAFFRAFTGSNFDLPTEAEWEYACRAGTGSAFNNGTANSSDCAWSAGSLTSKEVGTKRRNFWGLYDCHGNVQESCVDGYNGSTTIVVSRGGSYLDNSTRCRSAKRSGDYGYTKALANYGFRLWAPAEAH